MAGVAVVVPVFTPPFEVVPAAVLVVEPAPVEFPELVIVVAVVGVVPDAGEVKTAGVTAVDGSAKGLFAVPLMKASKPLMSLL